MSSAAARPHHPDHDISARNDSATLKLEAERKAGGMLTELRQAGELHAGRPNNADNASAFLSGFGISHGGRPKPQVAASQES